MAGSTGKMTRAAACARGPQMLLRRVTVQKAGHPTRLAGYFVTRGNRCYDPNSIVSVDTSWTVRTVAKSYSLRYLLRIASANS